MCVSEGTALIKEFRILTNIILGRFCVCSRVLITGLAKSHAIVLIVATIPKPFYIEVLLA
jgi:hypothetical protein